MVFEAITSVTATAVAFAALTVPFLYILIAAERLFSLVPDYGVPGAALPTALSCPSHPSTALTCEPSAYRTEIISLDPLLIYIHSFLHDDEIKSLLTAADTLFSPSSATESGQNAGTSERTSSSAGLPLEDHTVQCVLTRAREFMGAVMIDGRDDIGPPQLVRYTAGQTGNAHHDWYDEPRWADNGSRRTFNRVASFSTTLEDSCTGGETYFPYIGPKAPESSAEDVQDTNPTGWTKSDPIFAEHQDGGLAFRPIQGDALFLVNLHSNGSEDTRTMPSSLPVGEGMKTVMNIWPRRFFSVD